MFFLYLKDCFRYAHNILVASNGIEPISLGGLQADLKEGLGGGGATPRSGSSMFPSSGSPGLALNKEQYKIPNGHDYMLKLWMKAYLELRKARVPQLS